jgi:hypothetical protein
MVFGWSRKNPTALRLFKLSVAQVTLIVRSGSDIYGTCAVRVCARSVGEGEFR